jgi:hypothetical protein
MRLSSMLRNVAIRIWLPCQLVWQEAKVDTLDTSVSSLRTLFTHETSSWGSKKMCGTMLLSPRSITRWSEVFDNFSGRSQAIHRCGNDPSGVAGAFANGVHA